MRFFIDEDLSPGLVEECHEAGYDATCSRDRGKLGVSDRAVAELCMEKDRILVTNNASDFLALAEEAGLHPGLVVMPLATKSKERVWMTAVIRSIEKPTDASDCCRLVIYMASTDTTTIRVATETRDRLNALAVRRGEPAGEVVAKLVSAADEEAMLAEIAVGFEELASDPKALSAYRAESGEIESGFESPAPEW